MLDQEVCGAQHLLARVDPEREVVEPPLRVPGVGDVDQLVPGDREAEPGARLGAVVEDDALVVAVAEHVRRERAARRHVGGEQVDVVEPLDGGPAPGVALRLVAQDGLEVGRWRIPLGLVVELEDVAVRVGEPVGRAVADIAVDPADPEARRLDRRHPPLQALRRAGADRHVPEPRLGRLGQLEAVALVVAVPAEEDRLALGRLLLHSQRLDEEAEAALRLRCQKLGVADVREVAEAHLPNLEGLVGSRRRADGSILVRSTGSGPPA